MNRDDIFRNFNRSSYIFSHLSIEPPRNTRSSDVDLEHIWLEDDTAPGVQIVELESSDNPQTSPDDKETENSTWSHVYPDLQRYEENIPRERRNYTPNDVDPPNVYENDFVFGYYGNTADMEEDIAFKRQMNFFTVLDKRFDNSDSSEYEDSETQNYDTVREYNWNADDEDVKSYDYESVVDSEERTIRIYSFKNKRALSENNFELVNISSNDTSPATSAVEIEKPRKCVKRVATPIPTYVPRLVLPTSPVLPTVTEVTEPNGHSVQSLLTENFTLNSKPVNNWFVRENVTPNIIYNKDIVDKLKGSDSIVDWMALSPREKRRIRIKAPNSKQNLPTLPEVYNHGDQRRGNRESKGFENPIVKQKADDTQKILTKTNKTTNTNKEKYVDKATDPDTDEYVDIGDFNRKKNENLRKPQRVLPKTTNTMKQNYVDKITETDKDEYVDSVECNGDKNGRCLRKPLLFFSQKHKITNTTKEIYVDKATDPDKYEYLRSVDRNGDKNDSFIRSPMNILSKIHKTTNTTKENYVDKGTETDKDEYADSVDRNGDKSDRCFRKPRIRFSPKPVSIFSDLTEPRENIEINNWIVEDHRNMRSTRETGHKNVIHEKTNTYLVNQSHWSDYLPISCSLPSLQLSSNSETGSDVEDQSCCFIKCFQCFKSK